MNIVLFNQQLFILTYIYQFIDHTCFMHLTSFWIQFFFFWYMFFLSSVTKYLVNALSLKLNLHFFYLHSFMIFTEYRSSK